MAGPAWRRFLFVNIGCIAAYYVLLSFEAPGWVSALLYLGLAGSAAGAIWVGRRRFRSGGRAGWWWLAAGQSVFVAAETYAAWIEYFGGGFLEPSPADVLYVSAYPLLAAGLFMFVLRRTPNWNLASILDATIVAVGAGLLGWIYLVEPLTGAAALSTGARVVESSYPMMDVVLLVLAVRLVLGADRRPAPLIMVIAAMVLLLAADFGYALSTFLGDDPFTNTSDLGWLGCYALLGAAALHPSMTQLDERCQVAAPDGSTGRLVVLTVAVVAAPVVQVVQYLRGDDPHVLLTAVVCVIMLTLVMCRMAGLVAAQRLTATTDVLTGLKSRRFLEHRLTRPTRRSLGDGRDTGLLLIDVDHFKRINDTFGHPSGDAVLAEVARRLVDAMPREAVIARYGGEEFAVLLPATELALIVSTAESARRVIAQTLFHVGDAPLAVTVSVGAATMSGAPASEDLIRAADEALYSAKRAGRNRCVTRDGSGREQTYRLESPARVPASLDSTGQHASAASGQRFGASC